MLLALDVSGHAGARGTDGHRGADGFGSAGADGAAGGHAGVAGRGERAGRLEVRLHEDGAGSLFVDAMRRTADGRNERLRERRAIGERGFVDLVARGGVGGHGGRGGDGGDGARGRAGSDATRHSDGGNGGPGGDGGRGGRGTGGGDGGRGGAIVVTVRDEDSHLLMLVRHGVEGGVGGASGAHGRGGAAGGGGPGGSSHSWTTTESYRDGQGQSQTRTQHHSRSGGSRGPSGSPGASGQGPLHEGARGANGTLTFELETRGGEPELYEVRYHLAFAGLEVHTADSDGVTEPGERVELRRVRVTNVGGMPTPRHRDTEVRVAPSAWVRPLEGERLLVPRGLAAGASVELEGALAFELREHTSTAQSDPLAEEEPIALDARVPDVERSFEGFLPPALDSTRTLLVRRPVALSTLEALSALAPDELTRVRFAVRNQSRVALGADSPSQRRVRVRVHLHESELDDRHVVFFDERGRTVVLGGEGFARELPHVAPGEDIVFECALGLRADAPGYNALRVRLSLELGHLEQPTLLRAVQHRALEVRVAAHVGAAPFDWLLVTHHRTTREELDAWRALAKRMGRTLALYDLSLHGDLRLDRSPRGEPSLLERAQGGLVIVLGYPLTTPAGERSPTDFLDAALLHEMGRHRADLLVLGGAGSLRDWAVPESSALDAERAPLQGRAALEAALDATRAEGDAAGSAFGARVAIHEIVFGLEEPTPERLRVRAQALAERLARRFPDREHEVVYEFDPDLRPSWAPVRRRRLGWLRVLSRAAGRSGLARLEIDDAGVHDPAVIAGTTIAGATLLARGLDDRLRALAELLEQPSPDTTLLFAIADAVLVAVACEQLAVVRRTRARAGLGHRALTDALGALRALSQTRLLPSTQTAAQGVDTRQPAVVAIARLASRARFFARAQAALWERLPGLAWLRRTGAMIDATDDAIARFLACQSEDPALVRELEDQVRVELEVLEGQWSAARAQGARRKARFAKQVLLAPSAAQALTIDEELLLAHEPTVSSSEAWAEADLARHGAMRGASHTAASLEAERARLRLEGSTEARLAASAAPGARRVP